MTKAVSNMTVKESLRTSLGTQYKSASNYVSRLRQPQFAHSADDMLQPNVTCHYCKVTGHTKDNCDQLNNKIMCDIQLQEQVTAAKLANKKGTRPHVPKKKDFFRSWTNLEEIRSVVQTNLIKSEIE